MRTPVSPDARNRSQRPDELRERVTRQLADLAERPSVRQLLPTAERLQRHDLVDRSAALTYYGLLGIVPVMLVLYSLFGIFGSAQTVEDAIDVLGGIVPGRSDGPAREKFAQALQRDASSSALLGIGLFGVLWTASAYVGSFFRASATIWGVKRRPLWQAWPARVALTFVLLLMVAASAAAIVVTGQLAESIGSVLGLTQATVTLYEILKWPAVLALLVLEVGLLYRTSPGAPRTMIHWWLITPGSAFVVVAWLLVSGGFTLYVNVFGSYDTTYGALGATIASMVWLWLMNLVLLAGVTVDAELEQWRGSADVAP